MPAASMAAARRRAARARKSRRRGRASRFSRTDELLGLQKTAGNRAVSQLLSQRLLARAAAREPEVLQRAARAADGDDRVLSDADPSRAITYEQGLITTVAAGAGAEHKALYFEFAEKKGPALEPMSALVDLSTPDGTNVEVTMDPPTEDELDRLKSASSKQSWPVNRAGLLAALAEAQKVKEEAENYRYAPPGSEHLAGDGKMPINCARFVQMVLKAAGVEVPADKWFEAPSELGAGEKLAGKHRAQQAAAGGTGGSQ